nr:VOC family protein [Allorhizobium sonneratiae]
MVPELAVTDWSNSRAFYIDILGFSLLYERPEEGFSYLALGEAQMMIDEIGQGRTFALDTAPFDAPFEKPLGRGLNLQIRVDEIAPLAERLGTENIPLYLPLEDKWYRRGDHAVGNRQLIVADPDGYLLRFYQNLGVRPL